MVLTLYKLDASPPVRTVFMVLEALQIPDVEMIDVNLLSGLHLKEEYLKLNPQHTVPMLKDDDFLIWDSHAIATYLVGKYGTDDSLYPKDLKKRALVDQRLHFDSGILFPAMRGTVVKDIMVLTLYKLDFSPPVRSVFMVLEYLQIPDVEMIDVNIFKGQQLQEEYIKINPQHTIPVLKDDDFVICESHAIATYLLGKYAKDDSLYPKDLKKRALVDQRLHFDSGILFPSARGAGEAVLFRGAKEFSPEALAKITKGYEFSEKFLSLSPWMAGDELTLADICCVASISSMDIVVPIDEKLYPNLTDWFKRCAEFDFYKKGNVPGLEILRETAKAKLG